MRIHVQGLPFNQDFSTEFEVSPAFFELEPTQNGETDLRLLEAVHCQATLRKMAGDEVFLQIAADTTIEPTCDRCTESYSLPFHLDIALLCKPMTREPTEEEIEDEGLMYFTKQELHLDHIVREQLLLNLPMQYICRETCQGLCPGCGENLNMTGENHHCGKAKFFEYKAKVL